MNAVVIRAATTATAHARLAALARAIWHEHYPGIISVAQIDYMLDHGYSPATLAAEQAAGTYFMLAYLRDTAVGFAAISPDPTDTSATLWLDKLYVQADVRGSGVGRALYEQASHRARDRGATAIRLRVNRHNHGAVAAYRRLGFVIEREDIKPIGANYVMDDYVMMQSLGRQALPPAE